jgi:hypothetical protein
MAKTVAKFRETFFSRYPRRVLEDIARKRLIAVLKWFASRYDHPVWIYPPKSPVVRYWRFIVHPYSVPYSIVVIPEEK